MKKLFTGCLTIVGIVVVLGILGAIFGGGTRTQTATVAPAQPNVPAASAAGAPAQPAAAEAATAQPEPTAPPSYGVGQDVQVDQMRWKVLAAEDLGTTLHSDNQFVKDKTSGGRFVRVRFELENLSKDMLSFAGLDLVDAQGRTFKAASDAFAFIPQEEQCILENLNPNVAKSCTAIYEVPANASGLKAQVTDLKMFGSATEVIDLGLALP